MVDLALRGNDRGDRRVNQKLIAFAAAFALGTPAAGLAQSSNAQIYGRVHLGFDNLYGIGLMHNF